MISILWYYAGLVLVLVLHYATLLTKVHDSGHPSAENHNELRYWLKVPTTLLPSNLTDDVAFSDMVIPLCVDVMPTPSRTAS